ncbi:hypothetical protein M7I_4372 [Glarea lozoyensis 74030]|uniref:Uncharacterized protein n=1 Tax=Glarea lozoyensis (strain ATCC 74030 / MF5533) TaxID=1104152 RepID=H0EP07_GLAL7|nr:hypothetical protein M7I_4372 [Glarea lozoyensis 74030]
MIKLVKSMRDSNILFQYEWKTPRSGWLFTVAGLVGCQIHRTAAAGAHVDSVIVYTIVISGHTIWSALLLIFPLNMYINDLTMFILWMVDAPLLLQKPGGLSCDGSWQYNYWGYYWGTFWRDQPANFDAATDVGSSGCQQWNLVVIFAFVIAFSYLINFVIVGTF